MDHQPPPYLRQTADGKWEGTQYAFGRGDRVEVVNGPFKGWTGTVDSGLGRIYDGHRTINVPGYQVVLDDGRWLTVTWDSIKGL